MGWSVVYGLKLEEMGVVEKMMLGMWEENGESAVLSRHLITGNLPWSGDGYEE